MVYPAESNLTKYNQRKNRICSGFYLLAETEGFEPSIPFGGIHTFQACLFNHSSRSPEQGSKFKPVQPV